MLLQSQEWIESIYGAWHWEIKLMTGLHCFDLCHIPIVTLYMIYKHLVVPYTLSYIEGWKALVDFLTSLTWLCSQISSQGKWLRILWLKEMYAHRIPKTVNKVMAAYLNQKRKTCKMSETTKSIVHDISHDTFLWELMYGRDIKSRWENNAHIQSSSFVYKNTVFRNHKMKRLPKYLWVASKIKTKTKGKPANK